MSKVLDNLKLQWEGVRLSTEISGKYYILCNHGKFKLFIKIQKCQYYNL